MSEYRIDELARVAGTTSRNVRAYQERGLLPPPRKRGRIGIYTDTHLARLRLITSLHERGYTSAQITELITSWEQGRNLAEVLGLEEALNSPWSDEIPTYLPTEQVRAFLAGRSGTGEGGLDDEPELFDRIVKLGLLKPDGDQCLVPSPQLITIVAELLSRGFRLADLLSLHEAIAPAIDDVARRMVEAGAARLIEEHGAAWLPRGGEVGEATELLHRLRQLATSSVQSLLAHSLERHVADVMGEHLARVIKQNHPNIG
ncbi:MerR family transcriptional regulator [Pseudonocardia acaciae]|uniref:MerR family transcriptional regulator n=1 Tax=Pseudonocardia acaciae TaxID=551276 RepID=UPI00049211C6|nr:MerR family transcriptional regulator [Pseudonocardia acaciae]